MSYPTPVPPSGRLLPTGICWCGCGQETSRGAFFRTGHDKVAESAVVVTVFGGVAEFLVAFGFGPEQKNPREELESFRRRGGKIR